jgi:hypothetical protein
MTAIGNLVIPRVSHARLNIVVKGARTHPQRVRPHEVHFLPTAALSKLFQRFKSLEHRHSNKLATFELDLALYCLIIALSGFCPVTAQRLGCPRGHTRLGGHARQACKRP